MTVGEQPVGSPHLLVGLAETALDVGLELVTSHAREVTHAGRLHLDEHDEIVEDDNQSTESWSSS